MSHQNGLRHLVGLFGTASQLASATGYSRSYVSKLISGDREVSPAFKLKALEAANEKGLNVKEVGHMLDLSHLTGAA